jgi:hypothetical protein
MTIPFGPLRLDISLSRDKKRARSWEELTAAGMDDRELSRLNERNTRDFEGAPWAGLRLIYGAGRRP